MSGKCHESLRLATILSAIFLHAESATADFEVGKSVYPRSNDVEWNTERDGSGESFPGEDAGIPWFIEEVDGDQLNFRQGGVSGWCVTAEVVGLDGALEFFTSKVEEDSEDVWAINIRASIVAQLDRYKGAIADYDRMLKLEPSAAIYMNRGMAWRNLDDNERALADYDKSLELEPDYSFALLKRGQLLVDIDAMRALPDLTRAAELMPNHPDVYILLANRNENDFALFRRGWLQARVGNHDAGIADILKAIEIDPNYPSYRHDLGLIFVNLDRHQEAIEQLSNAAKIDPENSNHFVERGKVYTRTDKDEKALADFTKAKEIDPENFEATYLSGSSLLTLGRHDEALENFKAAYAINQRSAYIIRELAWLLATHPRKSQRDPAEALELTERLITEPGLEDPRFPETYAAVFAANDDFEQAVKWQKRALKGIEKESSERKAAEERLELYEAGEAFRLSWQEPEKKE